MGAELGNVHRGKQMRWVIEKEADIAEAAEGITIAFEGIGLPLLERLSNVKECLRLLSEDGLEAQRYCPISERRRKLAVALACALGDVGRAGQLIAKGRATLANRNEASLERFQVFASAVEERISLE
jgi:hypothetical protein